MNCPKCGAVLDDDAKFCVTCGAQIGETVINNEPISAKQATINVAEDSKQENASVENIKTTDNTKMSKIIGLVVGSAIIVIGIIRILTAGTSISPTSFGGDFYTYTYKGIVAVSEILASIEVSLGWIIVAIGAAIDVKALRN